MLFAETPILCLTSSLCSGLVPYSPCYTPGPTTIVTPSPVSIASIRRLFSLPEHLFLRLSQGSFSSLFPAKTPKGFWLLNRALPTTRALSDRISCAIHRTTDRLLSIAPRPRHHSFICPEQPFFLSAALFENLRTYLHNIYQSTTLSQVESSVVIRNAPRNSNQTPSPATRAHLAL